jgi:hypothetical protein
MATASISSSFVISVVQSAAAAETINVANPGRAMTINQVSIRWTAMNANPALSTVTISKVTAGGVVSGLFGGAIEGNRVSVPVQFADTDLNNQFLFAEQNSSFSATDNIRIVTADAATQVEVTLYCIGNPSASLVVT